mgnify:FL=1
MQDKKRQGAACAAPEEDRKGAERVKRLAVCIAAAVMAAMLSGCGLKLFKAADELYARPQLPEEYQQLERTIDLVMERQDVDYAAPISGSNASAVQLLDLDEDGECEMAVAFFRANASDDPQPLKIIMFRIGSDGNYNIAYTLEGEGNNINSIEYEDLDGDGSREVVVSWQLAARANVLSVYSLGPTGPRELIHTTYNKSYVLGDLNEDGRRELILIQQGDSGDTPSWASYYTFREGVLTMTSGTPLSANIRDITAVRAGALSGQKPAIYVTSSCDGGQVTDILTCREGELANVTLYAASGISNDTLRTYTEVSPTDINGDGVLEIPLALPLPSASLSSEGVYWVIYWRQFDADGKASMVCMTYHCVTDGWYLVLPNDWDGKIAVERDDRLNYRGERAVTFYYRGEGDAAAAPFLTILRLSGTEESVAAKAVLPGRRLLCWSGRNTAYAMILSKDGWDCGLTEDQVAERFSLITTEWATGAT